MSYNTNGGWKMRIEFGLLSIISLCVLLFFGFQGDVELYGWEVGFSVSSSEVKVVINPAWVVWTKASIIQYQGHSGMCIGNVVAVPAEFRGTHLGSLLVWHETNHVLQNQALGLLTLPLSLFLNIEGRPFYNEGDAADLTWLQHCNNSMWLPPDWWINQWHFFSFLTDIRQ